MPIYNIHILSDVPECLRRGPLPSYKIKVKIHLESGWIGSAACFIYLLQIN